MSEGPFFVDPTLVVTFGRQHGRPSQTVQNDAEAKKCSYTFCQIQQETFG